MPKRYSDQEKEQIKALLKEEAAKCLAQYGIRRTTVDELVQRVRIPKGTFYLFYPSKELLLFDVIMEQHDRIEKQIMDAVSALNPKQVTAQQLTEILFQFFKTTEEMPILKMLGSGEIEILARKLPPGVLKEHFGHDDKMIEHMLASFAPEASCDIEAVSAAFRAIYLVTLHKEEIGDNHYDKALRLLIQGVVTQIL